MIGLDTSAVIDLFKGDSSITNLLSSLNDFVFLNQVVYLELMTGLGSTKKHLREEKFYDDLFSRFPSLDLDFKSSKKARDISNRLKKGGYPIEISDCVIAGIYVSNGVDKIITRNKKHFEKVKGLKVLSY